MRGIGSTGFDTTRTATTPFIDNNASVLDQTNRLPKSLQIFAVRPPAS